jgi:hypothetical protein
VRRSFQTVSLGNSVHKRESVIPSCYSHSKFAKTNALPPRATRPRINPLAARPRAFVIELSERCGYLIALDTRNSQLLFEVNMHDVLFKDPTLDGIVLRRIWVLVEYCPQFVEEVGMRFRSASVFLRHEFLLSVHYFLFEKPR